jgi:hypothetical protein
MTESRAEEPVHDEGAPPGFMDRPDVKEAVEWALAQVARKGPREPGRSVEEIFDEYERRLASES